jgi:Cysteine rich repeat
MRVFASTPAAAASLALALVLLCVADCAVAEPTEAQIAAIKSNCRSDYMSYCWGVPRGGAEAAQCLKKNLAKLSAACQQAVKAATATAAPATPATAAKPATEAAPAAAAAEPAPSSPASSPSSGSASATEEDTAKAAPSLTPEAEPSPKTAAAPSAATSAQGQSTAKTLAAPAKASVEQPSEAETAGPAKPAATTAAVPPVSIPQGFIPPRKKLMVFRNCHQDLETYCADVPFGEGRQLSCLESNLATLTSDCRDALAKLGP